MSVDSSDCATLLLLFMGITVLLNTTHVTKVKDRILLDIKSMK